MAEKRIQVRESIFLAQFMPPDHPILVACEKCGGCASLREFTFLAGKGTTQQMGTCSCLRCGHQWSLRTAWNFYTHGPLWLRTPCHKNALWVLNRAHLDFLEQYIAAELREERMPDMSSRRLSSALPRWMLSGKNRDDVLRCLKKLREKLDKTEADGKPAGKKPLRRSKADREN